MMETNQSNLEELAQKLVRFEENPNNWGDEGARGREEGLPDSPWGSNISLQVWDWAEQNQRFEIKPKIVRAIARQINAYQPEKRDFWYKKFQIESENALTTNDLEKYVSYQEGMLLLRLRGSRECRNNILVLYRLLDRKEKVVYYLNEEANSLLSPFSYRNGKNMAWRLWIEAYGIGKEINYQKGLLYVFLGLGTYLSKARVDELASLFFYQAKLLAQKIKTPYGIIARDELRRVTRRSNIKEDFYTKEIDFDKLIGNFLSLILSQ